jgi:glucose/mannose transport system substrate-binding protein
MQIHGDWMKGEWASAGKVAGTDFGCINIPGTKALSVTVDTWGLLGGVADDKAQAELDFAAVVTDPQVQSDFAKSKGSTPVRLDAPADQIDACSKEVLAALQDEAKQVPNPHNTVNPDWLSAMWVTFFNFWSDPSMTTDAAIEQLKSDFETILG